jgi:hypothetical protein
MGVPELTDFGEAVQGRFALYGLTYEQGSLKVYQNGALRGTVQAALDLEDPTTHARLGSHFWYHDGKQACARLTASYDDLRVYNRALSAHEVRVLHDASGSTEPPEPAPKPVWPDGDVF